jgi:uncharacterized delta-60 repeat protein
VASRIRVAIALTVVAVAIVAAQAWAAAGALDHSFSTDGKKTFGFSNGAGDDEAEAVAIQRDGKIVVAGFSNQTGAGQDFAVARIKSAGGLDHSFSGDGRKTFGFANGTGNDVAYGAAIQPNGKIVVAGSSDQGTSGHDFAIARLNANGSLDHSFSTDGKMTFGFANGSGSDDAYGGVALQRDGKIVVAGTSERAGANLDFALARVKPGGGLDHSFSTDGRRTFGFANGTGEDAAADVAIQGDGRIVAGGTSYSDATGQDMAVARLEPNGGLDHSFSGDGRRTLGFGNGTDSDGGKGLALRPDGKIVVVGASYMASTGYDLAVARFRPDGSPDPTFSGDGRETTGFGNGGNDDDGNDVALQRDGKIVVGGESVQGAGTQFAVGRFKANGGLDHTFSTDGRNTIGFGNGPAPDIGWAVALQGNGSVIVAGYSSQPTTGEDFAVARFLGS